MLLFLELFVVIGVVCRRLCGPGERRKCLQRSYFFYLYQILGRKKAASRFDFVHRHDRVCLYLNDKT